MPTTTQDRDQPSGNLPDPFDRLMGSLHGLPDVLETKPSTIRSIDPLVGNTSTYIVQTIRQRELRDRPDGTESSQGRDYVFIEAVTRDGVVRLVLPPGVADAVARQRDGLTSRSRSKAARAVAQGRKDRGEAPAFFKAKR